ncbi:hypothetical protein [Microvirga sesbaniae]|uniref:hypothetical protein n=1 Tax=Microvirga sesbaniae TaxID=681392 RepID=UPI0021C7326F|nr:hypothetical protein [Microvirga sp. HBU67692]
MAKNFKHPDGYPFDYYGEHASFVDDNIKDDYAFRIEFSPAMPEAQRQALCALVSAAPKLLAAAKRADDLHVIDDLAAAVDQAEMFSDTPEDSFDAIADAEANAAYAAAWNAQQDTEEAASMDPAKYNAEPSDDVSHYLPPPAKAPGM